VDQRPRASTAAYQCHQVAKGIREGRVEHDGRGVLLLWLFIGLLILSKAAGLGK
jgi:hypothetical protein